jgi:phosphoribosylformylglycinamidine synthase subunit PurL
VVKRGGEKSGNRLGCKIDMGKVPTKYEMDPCNILISESQERMLIVTDEERVGKIYEIFNKWDLEYATIGETTMDGKYSVYKDEQLLYNENIIDHKDITEDWPIETEINFARHLQTLHSNKLPDDNKTEKIKNKELWQVYDSTVGNRTLKGPDSDGSYAVINIPEVDKKLYVTWGETFYECFEEMHKHKAKPLCIVNCLNFGHPKDSMTDFSKTIDDLTLACKMYQVPVVGGNVSLYNSTNDKSIRPTPTLMMLGIKE